MAKSTKGRKGGGKPSGKGGGKPSGKGGGKPSGKGGGKPSGKGGGKPSGRRSGARAPKAEPVAAASDAGSAVPIGAFVLGAILLAVAAGASLMLVIGSLPTVVLPGCGAGSDCESVARSVWGKVPGLGWPTSHVGLAWFLGLLGAWFMSRRGVGTALRAVVWLGGIVSAVLVIVMVVSGHLCMYCLAVHGANLAFLGVVEAVRRRAGGAATMQPAAAFGAVFVVATLGLLFLQTESSAIAEEDRERDAAASIAKIIISPEARDQSQARLAVPLEGRYRTGPDAAPIRIVVFSDFQCPDCNKKEDEIRQILTLRSDVSVSMKHFPFCTDCNPNAHRNLHPNACWAARASEAAGILGGNDGFWRMHQWLFDRDGSFVDDEINAALPGLGFDTRDFLATMMSPQTLAIVQEDINQAMALGIRQTPMIFINGEEFRGWHASGAVVRAVDEVAATSPVAKTAADDRPPLAMGKYIGDWNDQRVVRMPPDADDWTTGPVDAPAQVVVWGDYQEPYCTDLDQRIRAFMQQHDGKVRYSFRHYPFNQSCNPSVSRTAHPLACEAAQAAEAAGRLGGHDVYWRMHAWLFDNRTAFSMTAVKSAAAQMGLDPVAFEREMGSPEVAAAITSDAAAAKRLGLTGIPLFFVDGKRVPFWNLAGQPLPELMIERAINDG